MNQFLEFISFSNPNVTYVILGMICITASSALVGTFAFLRKRSLIGDAVAHSLLPGICLGYLFAGEKDPVMLMAGAFFTGWLSIFLVDYLVNHSRIKQDAAIGIVLSVFFCCRNRLDDVHPEKRIRKSCRLGSFFIWSGSSDYKR